MYLLLEKLKKEMKGRKNEQEITKFEILVFNKMFENFKSSSYLLLRTRQRVRIHNPQAK